MDNLQGINDAKVGETDEEGQNMKNDYPVNTCTSPSDHELFISILEPVSIRNAELLASIGCSASTGTICLENELSIRMWLQKEWVIDDLQIFQGINIKHSKAHDVVNSEQRTKNQAAIQLLKKWMSDKQKADYDKKAWPVVKKLIEDNRLSDRRRFDK
jgi:hypothetical protein